MIVLLTLIAALQQEAPVFTPAGAHPYRVSSASMAPTLEEGDVVLANRPGGDCGVTDFQPGDVVVAMRKGAPHLRRVVATAGQQVQMVEGVLLIDGVAVGRESLPGPTGATDPLGTGAVWRETLPNGRSYAILDFGPGQVGDETPSLIVPEGHVFALGDSRDNALDDRFNGPTKIADLCGVVMVVARSPVRERIGTRP